MNKQECAITLVELLIAVALLGLLILGIQSIDTFARLQLMTSDRRVQLQNELSYVLEDMSKNIVRATGDTTDRGIRADIPNGFRVRVDYNSTPWDYSDDVPWIEYALSGNRITKNGVSLNTRGIITAFTCSVLHNGAGIEIYLRERFQPSQLASVDNPELEMRTRVYSRSATAN